MHSECGIDAFSDENINHVYHAYHIILRKDLKLTKLSKKAFERVSEV